MLSKFKQVNIQERNLEEGLGIGGRIMREWILKK